MSLLFDSPGTVLVYASSTALVAMAFTLMYTASGFPNLYTGATMVYGIYSSYFVSRVMSATPYLGALGGLVISGAFSASFYWLVIRTMQRRNLDEVRLTLSTISPALVTGVLVNIVLYWFIVFRGEYIYGVDLRGADFTLFGVPGVVMVSPACVASAALLLKWIYGDTRVGAALRGSAESRELAMVCGVDPYRVQACAWFVSGGLVGVAGALYPLGLQGSLYVGTANMFTVVMAAGILGGLGSPIWAILGAFIIVPAQAVAEYTLSMAFGEYGGGYAWVIPPVVLWLTLLIEPGGLKSVYDRARRNRVNA